MGNSHTVAGEAHVKCSCWCEWNVEGLHGGALHGVDRCMAPPVGCAATPKEQSAQLGASEFSGRWRRTCDDGQVEDAGGDVADGVVLLGVRLEVDDLLDDCDDGQHEDEHEAEDGPRDEAAQVALPAAPRDVAPDDL